MGVGVALAVVALLIDDAVLALALESHAASGIAIAAAKLRLMTPLEIRVLGMMDPYHHWGESIFRVTVITIDRVQQGYGAVAASDWKGPGSPLAMREVRCGLQ